jgi:hypothetical protein
VEVKQVPSTDYAPDADCEKLVEKHKSVLKAGLYKLNAVTTLSLKSPGFNP